MVSIRFGFLEITYEGESPVSCSDKLCNRAVGNGSKCFVDTWSSGEVYCVDCGVCTRYHRKKADERGELSKPIY